VRRSDFNQDLSAAGACSSRSQELACSKHTTSKYRKRIQLTLPVMIPTFYGNPTFLPASRDIPLLPADLLQSDEFVPFKPELESLDDQPLLEK